MLLGVSMAVSYTVGGSGGGWDTSTNLQAWASSQTFSVGDNLVFQYTPNHDVVEVSKADYDNCQTSNPIRTYSGGNTIIALTSSGKRYFTCGTAGHCGQGMKVEIDTLATATPPPASPATPPPAVATPSTPPTASPATPSPVATPPVSAPTMSPPSLVGSPSSSPVVPSTETPARSPSPIGGSAPPPPSSAIKASALGASAMGFGFAMVMISYL